MILLDTNILICSKQPAHTEHITVTQKLIDLVSDGEELAICPQSLYELYVVATRPEDKNGFGMTSAAALQLIADLKNTHSLINDPIDLYTTWEQLILTYATVGKPAHDARLVAFMQAHSISHLYTLNTRDFNRYSSIITLVI